MKQLRYHYLRVKAMIKSPWYFNSSLWDTLSGEYYRSFTEKKIITIFLTIGDGMKIVDNTLEPWLGKAIDTNTTCANR